MDDIHRATRRYEEWLGGTIPLVRADLRVILEDAGFSVEDWAKVEIDMAAVLDLLPSTSIDSMASSESTAT